MPTRDLSIPSSLLPIGNVKYILSFLLLCLPAFTDVLQAQVCDCLSAGNCPVPLIDEGSISTSLQISSSGVNDLSQCPLESVCFTIEHTWIGDLSVSLTSPNGTNYLVMADINNAPGGCGAQGNNVDVCIVQGIFNPISEDSEYYCVNGPCSLGNCCLVGDWTMPWFVYDPISGAVQAPNYDLNDFNQPGAPVNGTWTLTVNDVCPDDSGILHNFSLNFACGESMTINPIITTSSPLVCPPDSVDDCQKVCANSTVVYEVENLSLTENVIWEVTGAESFEENGQSVTVNWGGPGEGIVNIDVENDPVGETMQLFCGYSYNSSNNANNVFSQVRGGTAPYNFQITSPNGNVLNFPGPYPNSNYTTGLASNGLYQFTVTDATGMSVSCEVLVESDPCAFMVDVSADESVFITSSINACDGKIKLSPLFAPNPISYAWSNGSTGSTLADICCGEVYSVTVTAGQGCTKVLDINIFCPPAVTCYNPASQCVQILQNPKADFSTTPEPVPTGAIEICQGQTVFFENSSTDATNYVWLFGDGKNSTEEAPSHIYQLPGTFTASLIARNDCFCADTASFTVIVQPTDIPTIDCLGSVCEGETVTYSTDVQCSSYLWEISGNGQVIGGGGTDDTSITVEWVTGPEGFVSLQTDGCGNLTACNSPNVMPIAIMSENAQIAGPDKVCDGTVAEYSIPDFIGANIVWKVSQAGTLEDGQGTNRITVAWKAGLPNPQYVSVFFENCFLGCEGRDTLLVNIKPDFYAGGEIQFCQFENGQFFSKNGINQSAVLCNWKLLDEDRNSVWSKNSVPTVNIPLDFTPGNYIVQATPKIVADYCNDFYEIPIRIFGLPPAVGGIDGDKLICPNNSYTYTAIGLGQTGIEWTVHEGGNSYSLTGNPINVTWGNAIPRSLTVTQTSTNGLLCTSDPTSITIEELPPVNIDGPIEACVETTQNYAASNNLQPSYEWSVTPADAGTISSGQGTPNISVQWHASGTAKLKLVACGPPDSLLINILPKPTPHVDGAAVCPGVTVPVATTENFASYQWKNALGNVISIDPNPTVGTGHYQVLVTDDKGCAGSGIFEIKKHPQPQFLLDIPYTPGLCVGGELPIYATTLANGLDFQWLVNGVDVSNNSPSYMATLVGSYVVTATDPNGCTASRSLNLPGCEENGGLCENANCVVVGGGSGVPPPPGGGICIASGALSFGISPTADCSIHNFVNTSVDFVPGSLSWNFDDPASGAANTSTQENPTHVFTQPGFFLVKVTGQVESTTPGQVCGYFFQKEDTILAVANFDAAGACPGLPMQFTDRTELMPFANLTGWAWDFGDPASGVANSSNQQNPSHTYAAPGNYTVTLTVTVDGGCQTVFSKNINVYALPAPDFTPPAPGCENTPINFAASGASGATSITWDFGDANSGAANTSGLSSIAHQFSGNGVYNVTLSASNVYGCAAEHNEMVSVLPNNLSGQITLSQPSPICAGDSVVLTASSNEPADILWSNGATSTAVTASTSGVYKATFTNQNGCTVTPPPVTIDVVGSPNASVEAVVYNENGQVGAVYQNNFTACEGDDVNLQVNGLPGYTYQWPNGSTGTEISFSQNTNNGLVRGNYVFTVTVTDGATGCSSLASINVEVAPVPLVQIKSNPAGIICENTPVTLSVTFPQPAVSYTWATGESGNSISAIGAGNYYAVAVNDAGCTARSNEIQIQNAPGKNNVPLGCLTRCLPTEICLPALPEVTSYQWYLDGQPLPPPLGNTPNPSFSQSGDYQLEMTDMDGCVSLSGILSLDLYNGYGQIAGEVYFDVNENGTIDAGDTTVSDVNIFLLDSLGIALDSALSNFSGVFSFANIPADGYTLQLDTLALPPGWVAILASQNEELVGCDDKVETVWLLYKVCLPLSSEEELAACAGESAMYNGTAVPAGGSQVFTLQNADGCDSIVTVSVAVLPHAVTPLEEAVCEGNFYEFQGQQIPIGETVIFTEINANGCLDTTIVSVSGLPTSSGSEVFSACPGNTINYLGVDLQPGDVEEFTLENWLGCDSLVSVSVLALPQTTEYVVGEVCDGEFFEFQGEQIPPGQTYVFAETNSAGCIDSIVVDVIKFVSSLDSLGFSACKGEYVTFDGTPVLAGDIESFSYPAANGCDSVIVVSVDTLPYKVSWVNESACEGAFFEYQGQQIASGETAIFTQTNSFGCKDTTVVSVATLPTSSGSEELNPCPGETASYLGTILQHGDVEVFTLQNLFGCDSLVTVTVTQLLTDTTYLTYQLCPGETVDYQGFEIAAGETSSFIFTDVNGCDSVVSVIAEQLLQAEFGYKVDSACADVADGKVEVIDILGGAPPLMFSLDGGLFQGEPIFENVPSGDHVLTVLNDNGCDEEKALVVPAFPPIDLVAFDETLPCGDSLLLRPDVNSPLPIQWEWFGEDGGVVSNAPELQIKSPGVYSFLVKNECETVEQSIVVEPAGDFPRSLIYMPNGFSPNNDGNNDCFRGYMAPNTELLEYQLLIFDRWGNQMFETRDIEGCWDGTFRGQEMDPAVFVWFITAQAIRCDGKVLDIFREGDVTVIK